MTGGVVFGGLCNDKTRLLTFGLDPNQFWFTFAKPNLVWDFHFKPNLVRSKPNEPKQDLRRVTELLFLYFPAGFDATCADCTLYFPPNQKWFGEPNLVWVQTKSETSGLSLISNFGGKPNLFHSLLETKNLVYCVTQNVVYAGWVLKLAATSAMDELAAKPEELFFLF